MTNGEYSRIGIGVNYFNGSYYWVQILAIRKEGKI